MRNFSLKNKKLKKSNSKHSKTSLGLVLIDQEPIRDDYIKKCKTAFKELKKAQNEWKEFESKDSPEFSRWYNSSFGEKISKIRDTHQKAGEIYHLVHEVYFYAENLGITMYQAYLFVMEKRKNEEKSEEDEWEKYNKQKHSNHNQDSETEDDCDDDFQFSDAELEMLFEQMLKDNEELKRKCKDPKLKRKLFEEFKKHFEHDENDEDKKEKSESESLEERVKSRYRKLVRILHPDYRENKEDQELDDIWHKVQEAYQNKDIEKLDMLLAICNIKEGNFSEEFSISQILDVSLEYKSQLKALKKKLKLAKKDDAWGFTKRKRINFLKNKIKNRLDDELKKETQNYIELQEIIQQISKPDFEDGVYYRRGPKSKRHYSESVY
ncbi:MAG: hypothetical protein KDK36_16445 [Leptospiraceae bacterium]|nr:hypothetical protein [Leptospiraceae bacterium]